MLKINLHRFLSKMTNNKWYSRVMPLSRIYQPIIVYYTYQLINISYYAVGKQNHHNNIVK